MTGGAAPKLALPGWLAVIEQFPAETMVILRPLTVQTAVVLDTSDTVRPEDAVAFDANGVVLKFNVPGLAKVMVCAAAAIVSVTAWLALGKTPFDADTVKLKVPAAVGVPLSTPAPLRLSPAGSVPELKANTGAGEPVAVKVCVYAVLTTPPAGAALVKAGAWDNVSVSVGAIGEVAELAQVPSVSISTDDAALVLKT